MTYEDWSDPVEAPRTLTAADLDAVLAAGTPFCRKVDPLRSATLLDELDRVNGVNGP